MIGVTLLLLHYIIVMSLDYNCINLWPASRQFVKSKMLMSTKFNICHSLPRYHVLLIPSSGTLCLTCLLCILYLTCLLCTLCLVCLKCSIHHHPVFHLLLLIHYWVFWHFTDIVLCLGNCFLLLFKKVQELFKYFELYLQVQRTINLCYYWLTPMDNFYKKIRLTLVTADQIW